MGGWDHSAFLRKYCPSGTVAWDRRLVRAGIAVDEDGEAPAECENVATAAPSAAPAAPPAGDYDLFTEIESGPGNMTVLLNTTVLPNIDMNTTVLPNSIDSIRARSSSRGMPTAQVSFLTIAFVLAPTSPLAWALADRI